MFKIVRYARVSGRNKANDEAESPSMSGFLTKRSRATMLAAAGAVVISLVPAGGAQAAASAQTCTIKSYTPAKFVVTATDTEKQFKVKTTGCTQKNWRVDLIIDGDPEPLATMAEPVVTFFPSKMDNTLAGGYKVLITVKSSDDKISKKKFNFALQRKSTFGSTLNVGPETVAAGDTLKVVGTLKRVSWGPTPKYVAYGKQTVQVQFKASGTTTYKKIKSVVTATNGKISTTVPAKKSGTWRLTYAGNGATGTAISKTDGITVG
jgi:hypothetical protein